MLSAANIAFTEYDADQIRIAGWGYSISKGIGQSGYADGKFCSIKPDGPSFTSKRGTDGFITRSKTYNFLVEVTLYIAQSNSPTNNFLSALLAADELNPNGTGVGTFNIQDLAGTAVLNMPFAWLVGIPEDWEYDREAGSRTWLVHGVRSGWSVGGN